MNNSTRRTDILRTATSWETLRQAFATDCEAECMERGASYYADRLNQFLKWVEAEKIDPASFKGHDLTRYVVYRKSLGRAPSTVAHDAKTVCKFFRFAAKSEFLPRNPVADYKVRNPPAPKVNVPTKSQLDKLLSAVDDAWNPAVDPNCRFFNQKYRTFYARCHKAILAGKIATSCRIGELLTLKKENYDPVKMKAAVTGKGGITREVRFSQAWVKHVAEWLKVRPKFAGDEGYLFINKLGGKIDYSRFRRSYDRYRHRADMDLYKLHGIRHHSITVQGETDLLLAQTQAGHASIQTTMRYVHPTEAHLAAMYAAADPLAKVVVNKRSEKQKKKPVI